MAEYQHITTDLSDGIFTITMHRPDNMNAFTERMMHEMIAAFDEAGDPFDPHVAKRLEETGLSSGGSVYAAELYTRVRGGLPGVSPRPEGSGLGQAA